MDEVKRVARFVHPLAAGAIVSLVFLQVYLIAAYIFGDSGVLDAHMTVGRVTVAFELLVLVTALVGWWGNRSQIATSSALFLTGAVQALLASMSIAETCSTFRRSFRARIPSPQPTSSARSQPGGNAQRRSGW